MTSLCDLGLLSFGTTIQMAGVVFQGAGRTLVAFFPDDADDLEVPLERLNLSQDDWVSVIRQTDLLETEILSQAADGSLVKVVMRKSQRQIEQGISWQVFKRDGYSCRYCGKDDVPLTVDHLICWESGGPSIPSNLVAACRRCNKNRGNLAYADWLSHPYYKKVSGNLSPSQREANAQLLHTLAAIPLSLHKKSR